MRVPIPVVILLVLAVMGGVWLRNTRHMDFVTPPSSTALAAFRLKIESSLPRSEVADDAISVPPVIPEPEPPPPPIEVPQVDLGNLTTPPTLESYAELSPGGAGHLIELAQALEEKGEFERALLAWERVLDSAKPDEAQANTAVAAIKRLRPTLPDWNTNPAEAVEIVLHAGTGKNLAKTLIPILDGVARDLQAASSGTVKFKPVVTAGKTSSSLKGAPPVALWLAGPDKKSTSTEVLSFKADSPDTLRREVMKTVFVLMQAHLARSPDHPPSPPPGATILSGAHLARSPDHPPPATLEEGEDPQSALNFRITRKCWRDFGVALNVPAPKKPQ